MLLKSLIKNTKTRQNNDKNPHRKTKFPLKIEKRPFGFLPLKKTNTILKIKKTPLENPP
jgi:hypothetical protein